jgi:hypothetical protein
VQWPFVSPSLSVSAEGAGHGATVAMVGILAAVTNRPRWSAGPIGSGVAGSEVAEQVNHAGPWPVGGNAGSSGHEADRRVDRLGVTAIYLLMAAGAACVWWSSSYAASAVSPMGLGLLLMAAAFVGSGIRRSLRGPGRLTWRSAILPVIVAVTATFCLSGAPLAWRWATSEAAFNRLVATLPPMGPHQVVTIPTRVGWYTLSFAEVYPSGYVLTAAGTDDLTDCGSGFAYSPHGPDAIDLTQHVFVRIHGAWYRWSCYS